VAADPADLADLARAVSDGLRGAGISPIGADGIPLEIDAGGVYRVSLDGVDPATAAMFATALDDVLAPLGSPRYGRAWLAGRAKPNGAVYHAVPSVLATNAERAKAFTYAWSVWISRCDAIYSGSPEGTRVLASVRGADPFDVITVLRLGWH